MSTRISEAIYEGRLQSAQQTQDHCITTLVEPNGNSGNGILFIPVAHTDNQQSSQEEVDAIEQLITQLVGHSFTGERQSTI